jgi:DNA (cytosine-5)-methyltransferase 1
LGVALQASVIIIENVPQVVRSSMGVVDTAKWLLRTSGYLVTESTIDAGTHLCAQSRKRHFLFAHKGTTGVAGESILTVISKETRAPKIAVSAVIGDLLKIEASGYMDEPSVLSDENTERIRYLFKKDLYELPNKIRPVCHRNGHTYPSVYGRMRWDEPAQTITSGFLSPGRGRFIHPRLPRALTLHEGARIQGFPDGFVFGVAHESLVSRGLVSQMIADAVPPSLGAVLGLAAAAVLGQATGTGPIPFPSVPCLLKAQKRPRSPKG